MTVPTQEYVNGDYITVNAAFRKYASWNDSVVDHAKFSRVPSGEKTITEKL